MVTKSNDSLLPLVDADAAAAAEAGKGGTRVQVLFDAAAMKTLDSLKSGYRAGAPSTAGVIRDALGFMSWAADEIKRGNRIAVIDSQNNVREVILPFSRS